MPLGQLDRLPAALRGPHKRSGDLAHRLVGQAAELQIGPPDPARQRDALLQVPLCLLQPGRPELGDAQADQRQRAQLLAQARLRRRPGPRPGPAAAAPPRPPPAGCRAAGPTAAGPPRAAPAPARAGLPAPTPTRARPAPGTAPPPPATPAPAHRPRPPPPARHPPHWPRRGTRPAAHGWWRPAHPGAGPASGRPAAGRPAPSPAPPGRDGPPPPGTRAPQTIPRPARAARPPHPARCGAAAAAAGRRTGGGSGTRIAPRPATPRTRSPSPDRATPARRPEPPVSRSASSPLTRSSTLVRSSSRRTCWALPVQHLGQQVLGHRPLGAGELGREPVRIRVPGQRQRRQPQPRRPPLGPVHQQRQRRVGQPHPGRRQQLPRLGQAEPQIIGADLGQLPLQPQPVQPQPHVMPGGQHEPQLLRRAHHQQLQLPPRLGPSPARAGRRSPATAAPPAAPGPSAAAPRSPTRPDPAPPSARAPAPTPGAVWRSASSTASQNRCGSRSSAPGRHPRRALGQARLADPGPQQHRLAAARRRRHHRHPRRRPPAAPTAPDGTPLPPGRRSGGTSYAPRPCPLRRRQAPLTVVISFLSRSPAQRRRISWLASPLVSWRHSPV